MVKKKQIKSNRDVVTVKDLQKTYDGQKVVDGISFSVKKGEVFGILGPLLVGLMSPANRMISVRSLVFSRKVQVSKIKPSCLS